MNFYRWCSPASTRRAFNLNSRCLALIVLTGVAAGCSKGVKPPPPTAVAGIALASQTCNPDANGTASPLTVRIYELRGEGRFKASDFLRLYEKDKSALADELIAREDFELLPGKQVAIARELKAETRVLAVFGEFSEFDRAKPWGTSIQIPTQKKTEIRIECTGLALTLDGKPAQKTAKKWLPW